MFTIKKQLLLFLSIILCNISIINVSFAGHIETQQVLTPNGLISIKDLKVGDLVISYNFNTKKPENLFINTPIIKTQKNYADALYEIYIEDNRCISASPQQKFLVATQEDKDQESLTFGIEVIEAQYLTSSHMLLDSNLLTIPITQTHKKELYKVERRVKKYFWKSIKRVKRKTIFTRIDLYSIELQEPHNYLIPVFSQGIACKDDKNIPLILMHNGLPALAAGISLAFGSTPASLSFAGASIAAGGLSLLAGPAGWAIGAAAVGSYALYTLFDKGHKEQLFLEMSIDKNSDDNSKNQELSEKNKDPKGNKNPPPPPPFGKKDRDKEKPIIDKNTGKEIGRFIVDNKGNIMVEPIGGKTIPAGKNGIDTHTTYPNGSNYQRLNPHGHPPKSDLPHGHAHLEGTGPGKKGQGPSINTKGNIVPNNSSEAHWPIY
ncbi:MAG: RHS repeat-associated core domain protein [candidate division TM6 bacterium GW2011_GWF2_38_10]|nr:MAG: RHS repeat-associated core domain protein [candidate division TM6 bacterium GW2011_GWF2_38_10]